VANYFLLHFLIPASWWLIIQLAKMLDVNRPIGKEGTDWNWHCIGKERAGWNLEGWSVHIEYMQYVSSAIHLSHFFAPAG
jgi:hypothetical protein